MEVRTKEDKSKRRDETSIALSDQNGIPKPVIPRAFGLRAVYFHPE